MNKHEGGAVISSTKKKNVQRNAKKWAVQSSSESESVVEQMIAGNSFHSNREMKLEKVNGKSRGTLCFVFTF